MTIGIYPNVSGTYPKTKEVWCNVVGTTPTFIKQWWVNVSGTWELVFAAIQPFNQDFSSVGAISGSVPYGATSLTAYCTGGGSSGQGTASFATIWPTNGGAAGGTAIKTLAVAQADWGASFSGGIGAGGARSAPTVSNPGSSSTFGVTLTAGTMALTGGGSSDGVTGGAATGETGWNTRNNSNGNGGASHWAAGGVGGTSSPNDGSLGSGGGGPGNTGSTVQGGAGGNGFIRLAWS